MTPKLQSRAIKLQLRFWDFLLKWVEKLPLVTGPGEKRYLEEIYWCPQVFFTRETRVFFGGGSVKSEDEGWEHAQLEIQVFTSYPFSVNWKWLMAELYESAIRERICR